MPPVKPAAAAAAAGWLPLTVMIHGSSRSFSCFESSLDEARERELIACHEQLKVHIIKGVVGGLPTLNLHT